MLEDDLKTLLVVGDPIGKAYRRGWNKLGITWYDHRFDWAEGPKWWNWMERGVFGNRYIHEGDEVLDLGSGDGIFAGFFFAKKARLVHGLDKDPRAIAFARRLYEGPKVEFFQKNMVTDEWPQDHYDAVMWFGIMELLRREENIRLLERIRGCLENSKNGVMVGSTLLKAGVHKAHVFRLRDEDQLRQLLEPFFETVEIWTTRWEPHRLDVFFMGKVGKDADR